MKLSEAIDRGTLAARPAAGVEGRLYYVTDDDKLYRDSGSAWEVVAEPTVVSDPVAYAVVANQSTNATCGGASGTYTKIVSAAITDAPAGRYMISAQCHISSHNNGSFVTRTSPDDATWTNTGHEVATHNVGGSGHRSIPPHYYDHVSDGTFYLGLFHRSEGSNVTYGYFNDSRWATRGMAIRIGDIPS